MVMVMRTNKSSRKGKEQIICNDNSIIKGLTISECFPELTINIGDGLTVEYEAVITEIDDKEIAPEESMIIQQHMAYIKYKISRAHPGNQESLISRCYRDIIDIAYKILSNDAVRLSNGDTRYLYRQERLKILENALTKYVSVLEEAGDHRKAYKEAMKTFRRILGGKKAFETYKEKVIEFLRSICKDCCYNLSGDKFYIIIRAPRVMYDYYLVIIGNLEGEVCAKNFYDGKPPSPEDRKFIKVLRKLVNGEKTSMPWYFKCFIEDLEDKRFHERLRILTSPECFEKIEKFIKKLKVLRELY